MGSDERSGSPGRRLGLALSGGGFRATLFHLGVVRFLRDEGLLRDVTHICAVSGGSVLAAHLALNWGRYTGSREAFEEAAAEILQFVRSDVRGRVVRRKLLDWLTPYLWPFRRPRWTMTNLLQRHYHALYRGATLDALGRVCDGVRPPEVHLLSTSMTTGAPCAFNAGGFWTLDCEVEGSEGGEACERRRERPVRTGRLPVALAVAASSAFPPVFPPVELTCEMLQCGDDLFKSPQYLTDGGVYDNLGIQRLLKLKSRPKDQGGQHDLVILSDAGARFGWSLRSRFADMFTCTRRTCDLLMKQIVDLTYDSLKEECTCDGARILYCRISDVVGGDDLDAVDEGIQRSIGTIRTDLDRFSDEEIHAIVRHGYRVARQDYRHVTAGDRPPDRPAAGESSWNPVPGVRSSKVDVEGLLNRSKVIRPRLWSWSDWASYATVLAVLLLASPLLAYLAYQWRARAAIERAAQTAAICFRLCRVAGELATAPDATKALKVSRKIQPEDLAKVKTPEIGAAVHSIEQALDGDWEAAPAVAGPRRVLSGDLPPGYILIPGLVPLLPEPEASPPPPIPNPEAAAKGTPAPTEAAAVLAPRASSALAASSPYSARLAPVATPSAVSNQKPGGPAPDDLKRAALALAHACRDVWTKERDEHLARTMGQMRQVLYRRTYETADRLVMYTSQDAATGYRHHAALLFFSKDDRKAYWELYWGELAMVESKAVEDAMFKFGRALDQWERLKPDRPEIKEELASIKMRADHLKETCERELDDQDSD